MRGELAALLGQHTTKDAAAILAARHGLPRRDVYALALPRGHGPRRGDLHGVGVDALFVQRGQDVGPVLSHVAEGASCGGGDLLGGEGHVHRKGAGAVF